MKLINGKLSVIGKSERPVYVSMFLIALTTCGIIKLRKVRPSLASSCSVYRLLVPLKDTKFTSFTLFLTYWVLVFFLLTELI